MSILQKKEAHLDMIEGVVVDCLHAKWKAFIGARLCNMCYLLIFEIIKMLTLLFSFVKQFICYLLFLGLTVAAFGLRSIETKVVHNLYHQIIC